MAKEIEKTIGFEEDFSCLYVVRWLASIVSFPYNHIHMKAIRFDIMGIISYLLTWKR